MRAALFLVLFAALGLAGCGDGDMADQPSLRDQEASDIWGIGTSVRPLPEGAIAQIAPATEAALAVPPPVSEALLHRGQEDFETFCAPCHGFAGDGDGIIVQRGFSPPPSYHSPRLRAAPASHFIDVITNGFGAMYSFADRVTPEERWAIVAYIRALQLSREASLAEFPEASEKLR
ncbi:c-type cytochrome [Consotaella salsifontis]|uniref:Cytochrome C oxidase, cbb3-type, subunit III n=1 Tax=Consotaella salsifontis TaxID=1365950 RepID=A0A1T4PP71_9HYPH|nr:cytochrome c [Consotaella salsifontis]SJZ93046.1 Cytochrome C oxidase, cbb3-type, subunit III [Consotaella salsifontis]